MRRSKRERIEDLEDEKRDLENEKEDLEDTLERKKWKIEKLEQNIDRMEGDHEEAIIELQGEVNEWEEKYTKALEKHNRTKKQLRWLTSKIPVEHKE